jgi:mono/diheme cytochrome c family protein
MIRAAFLVLVVAATPAIAQTTKKPPATKTGSTKTGSTKTGSTKTASTKTASTKTASAKPPMKSALTGVYTLEEATAGKELYAGLCASCHLTANQHNAPEFRKKWTGKPLSDLFVFMKASMPKNDPGSLAEEDYGVILAYMLQMNKMPPGKAYLSTDTLELRKIKFDTVRSVRKP